MVEANSGQVLEAWRTLIAGLKQNPGNEETMKLAREVAEGLSESEREIARRELRDAFGPEASDLEWKLMAQAPRKIETLPGDEALPPGHLHLPIDALGERPERDQRLPAPDPAQPGSAEEGLRT